MAKRNIFQANPNQSHLGMRGVHNGGGDPRSRMLAQRDAERKRVAARAAPPVANTYEGRQAQQQAYLQSVQMQKQQMQMDNAMRKQVTNSNIKPEAYDPNAKAATNRAINETRNAKASREAIWEEKRRRHLANRGMQQNASNTRQPVQNLQQNYRGHPARTVQEVQPRQVKPSAGTYAGQLNKQISDRKQISLQNDAAQQPTTSMGIGSTVTHTGDMQKKKAAQQEYATALRSQMAMQEQRKREEKGLQRHPNQAQYQQNVPYDRAMEEQRRKKQQYRQELDAQMKTKKENELRNRSGASNNMMNCISGKIQGIGNNKM